MSAPEDGLLDAARRRSVGEHHVHINHYLPGEYTRTVVGDSSVRPATLADRHPRIERELHRALGFVFVIACYVACLALAAGFWDLWEATF